MRVFPKDYTPEPIIVPVTRVVSESTEMVNHPNHYQSNGKMEVIDVIEAFTEDLKGVEAFDTANAIKYICRWSKKGTPLQDLMKAKWYVEHLINKLEKEKKNNE